MRTAFRLDYLPLLSATMVVLNQIEIWSSSATKLARGLPSLSSFGACHTTNAFPFTHPAAACEGIHISYSRSISNLTQGVPLDSSVFLALAALGLLSC